MIPQSVLTSTLNATRSRPFAIAQALLRQTPPSEYVSDLRAIAQKYRRSFPQPFHDVVMCLWQWQVGVTFPRRTDSLHSILAERSSGQNVVVCDSRHRRRTGRAAVERSFFVHSAPSGVRVRKYSDRRARSDRKCVPSTRMAHHWTYSRDGSQNVQGALVLRTGRCSARVHA